MTELAAGEITADHVGRFVRFKRPGDVQYGGPVISGRLAGVRRWRDGSGRDLVTLAVGRIGEVDLSHRYPVHVGHLWRRRPAVPDESNVPSGHNPILLARLHGGPANGRDEIIGGDGDHWDGKGVIVRVGREFAYYEHTHVPEGVERPATPTQRQHGYGPTVFVGTVHMNYRKRESEALNARRAVRVT